MPQQSASALMLVVQVEALRSMSCNILSLEPSWEDCSTMRLVWAPPKWPATVLRLGGVKQGSGNYFLAV